MTRLGLIARADSRGLGIQTHEFYRHMRPAKTIVIEPPSKKPLPIRHDWYTEGDITWIKGWPTPTDYANWLVGLDVIFTCETAYHPSLFALAQQLGVKSVLQPNYELFDYLPTRQASRHWTRPDLYALPSVWHQDDFPDPKTFLPVPIALDRFQSNTAHRAERILHVVGRPAVHDRNGTLDFLRCLQHVTAQVDIIIRCQQPGYITLNGDTATVQVEQPNGSTIPHTTKIPDGMTIEIVSGDLTDYWHLYTDADALVLPRRFGGLCLPAQEATGAGLPVVMPDLPENQWLPNDLLIPAEQCGRFMAHNPVDLHKVDPTHLAAQIDKLTNPTEYRSAVAQAETTAKQRSWDQLKPLYQDTLAILVG